MSRQSPRRIGGRAEMNRRTPLYAREYFLTSKLHVSLNNFKECPLVLCTLLNVKNLSTAILSIPFSILNVSIKSPLILLVSSVVKFKATNRSSYGLSFNAGTNLVALF